MLRTRLPALAALLLSPALPGPALAGPMLTGTVSYDRATRLYTYAYTLDARAPLDAIGIRVATLLFDWHLWPASAATPAPSWKFDVGTSFANPGSPTAIPRGTFFLWYAATGGQPLRAGARARFAFTTPYAPSREAAADYYLSASPSVFPPLAAPDGYREVGRVVAPDYTQPLPLGTPEPACATLALLGLAGCALAARRRHPRGPD